MSDTAVDNDVLLKAISYGLESHFWPKAGNGYKVGVLGAARYVVGDRIAKAKLGRQEASQALADFLGRAEILEPTEGELKLASEIELAAQQNGLPLDAGESQLGAMVIKRNLPLLETGDKRAITSLEQLLAIVAQLESLAGRVRCLEQIVYRIAEDSGLFMSLATAICAEADVDKSLAICFSCFSGATPRQRGALEALLLYIEDLRHGASTVLEAGP